MANEINNITGKNVSWDSINSELKKNNASEEQIKTANSIFSKLDSSGDGTVNDEELNKFYGDFKSVDTDGDGVLSEDEVKNAPDDSLVKTFGTKVNGFMSSVKNIVTQTTEAINEKIKNESPEGSNQSINQSINHHLLTVRIKEVQHLQKDKVLIL